VLFVYFVVTKHFQCLWLFTQVSQISARYLLRHHDCQQQFADSSEDRKHDKDYNNPSRFLLTLGRLNRIRPFRF